MLIGVVLILLGIAISLIRYFQIGDPHRSGYIKGYRNGFEKFHDGNIAYGMSIVLVIFGFLTVLITK